MLALKPCLIKAGIAQAELARSLEVSEATMAQIINHDKWPKKPGKTALCAKILLTLHHAGVSANSDLFLTMPAAVAAATGMNVQLKHPTLTLEATDMLLRKQTLTQEARQLFGVGASPFDRDVESAGDVFTTRESRSVREYMWQTAKSGGFLAVVGESGAGKTTLRMDLEDRIEREGAAVVLIQPGVLGMTDSDKKGQTLKASAIMDAIILTVAPEEKVRQGSEAKQRQLFRVLSDSRKSGFTHCLLIEEAHALSIQTLKHLKRFIELKVGFKELLSIILIGQTELKQKLNERSPEVREVTQRCEVVTLLPLNANLEEYLGFKFKRVGLAIADVFEGDAFEEIRTRLIFTKGGKGQETVSLMYPLMVNNLVVGAMNACAAMGFSKVNADLIRNA